MSSGAVRTAFRSRLSAHYAGRFAIVETVNRKAANRPEEFVTLDFFPAEERQASTGGAASENLFRERGVVIANVFGKAGAGDADVIVEADFIRGVFRRARMPTSGGAVIVESVSPPDTGDGDDKGLAFRAFVEIAYRYEFTA